MVRVRDDPMLASTQSGDPVLEVGEDDVVVKRVLPRRLEMQSDGTNGPNRHERQAFEANQRILPGQLVPRGVQHGEDRDAVRAIDGMIAKRIRSQHLAIEWATTNNDNVIIMKLAALSEKATLHSADTASWST
jgi:hypothetical protein